MFNRQPDDLFGDLIPGRQPRPFAQPAPGIGSGAGWMRSTAAQGPGHVPDLFGSARAQAQVPNPAGAGQAQPGGEIAEAERNGGRAFRMGRAEADFALGPGNAAAAQREWVAAALGYETADQVPAAELDRHLRMYFPTADDRQLEERRCCAALNMSG